MANAPYYSQPVIISMLLKHSLSVLLGSPTALPFMPPSVRRRCLQTFRIYVCIPGKKEQVKDELSDSSFTQWNRVKHSDLLSAHPSAAGDPHTRADSLLSMSSDPRLCSSCCCLTVCVLEIWLAKL